MMFRTDMDHLPWPIRQELRRATAMLFEAFAETIRGKTSEHYRAGRILKLILHGPHMRADWNDVAPGEAFHLLAIVNYPRLARKTQDWRLVHDRLLRAWEHGEIAHPVRLTVESLERVNRALINGVPHFVTIATEGIALYEFDGIRLETPRRLPAAERRARGVAEFARWYERAGQFLIGADFYGARGNVVMAALMLHQACEHLYLCVSWSLTLHGLRTHALDQLREVAEGLDARLVPAWPRGTSFERRAFGCIRRAYVEVRYGTHFRITPEELGWAMDCAASLAALVAGICGERLELPLTAVPIGAPDRMGGTHADT